VDKLTCTTFVELATEYLDGSLDDDAHALATQHLTGCWACIDYLGELRATIRLMSSLPSEGLGRDLESHLLTTYREWVASVTT
jgi:anti-sigma factor RsiW